MALQISKNKLRTGTLGAKVVVGQKLTATMDTGFVLLPLTAARIIASNDIPNTAADGGVLSSNTSPVLKRLNGATDKSLIINWAAGTSVEVTWQVMSPPDIDISFPVVFHCVASMSSTNDAPVIGVALYEGIAGTNIGSTFTANMAGTPTEKTVSMTSAAIGTDNWEITVIPGTHATDAFRIHWAWVEYTRK